jgi:2EXR family/Chromo (CHRromatin Organisation MOdifier) domain
MPAQFSSFPWELRHQIYHLALDRTPRNVEVEVRDGRVVSKTPPPALLHLNRESRDFVLSAYKPWLPQFAGTPAHTPYAALLAKYRPSKTCPVSCLDDVCFDMERDTLFCKSMFISPHVASGWPTPLFGRIEESCLREMTVNIEGYLDFKSAVVTLMNAKNLRTLWFLDVEADEAYEKVDIITDALRRMAKSKASGGPRYVPPTIRAAPTSFFLPSSGPESPAHWHTCPRDRLLSSYIKSKFESEYVIPSQAWTTYKYPPPSYRAPTPSEEVHVKQEQNSRKRKADKELDAALAAEAAERNNRTHIWIRAEDFLQMSEETKRQLGITERAASSTSGASSSSAPASEASSSPPQSEASSSRSASDAGSVQDEDDNSDASGSESNDDVQDEEAATQERTPRQLHAHRFNFDISAPELLVEWEDSPEMVTWEWVPHAELLPAIPVMVAAYMANNPALETGTPIRFHERNSGVVGFDFLVEFEGYSEEIYWTWVPETYMQASVPDMVDRWMIENASEVTADENVDEQILAEQDYAENVRGDNEDKEEIKNEEEKEEEAAAEDEDMKDKDEEDTGDEEEGDEETTRYVPKRFVAQRETPDGPEILVEWEDWPEEKDYTWEPVSNLQEDAPEMMKAWKASRKPKKVLKVYEVETILGKRKIKGEWHYLVKWKGFSKDEAKSLEPCEKLAVDVPELVEAFENHKPKRGRRKKTASA